MFGKASSTVTFLLNSHELHVQAIASTDCMLIPLTKGLHKLMSYLVQNMHELEFPVPKNNGPFTFNALMR